MSVVVIGTDMCNRGGRLVAFARSGVIAERVAVALPWAQDGELR
jgi:hypothetical protein